MISGEVENLFPPPSDAVSLYVGPVMHTRMKPVHHRFSYRVFSILIDLDAYKAASRLSHLFAVNRFNLLSFYEKDHGPRDGSSLLGYATDLFKNAGVEINGGRILLLCYPRIFGYVFDPLSVYFGYSKDGRLRGVLYEVRNTFGEAHTYVEPVTSGQLSVSGLRQEREKLFYVSPFNPLTMRYFFRLRPPTSNIALRILVKDISGPVLSATFAGIKQEFTTKNVAIQCLTIPFLTLKIILGIHWEAFWLWVKGMRLVRRTTPPPKVSFPGDKREHSALQTVAIEHTNEKR
jgi:DUF1365 family protein